MSKKRRKIAVADAETDPFKKGEFPDPFIWGFYDGDTYEEFSNAQDFIEFVRDKDIIVYAHNGGKFDYFFLLDYLEPFTEVMIISGRLARFKIGECEFRDSYNIVPVPMSAYIKQEFDYSILSKEKRNLSGNMKKIKDYLHSDCINQFSLVSKFIERFGMHLTLAGAAMKTWSRMTDNTPPRSTAQFYDYFKRYYYGGRVECFESGYIEREFTVIDINSAYPRAMLEKHPFSLSFTYFDGTLEELFYNNAPEVIGGCFFTISAKSYGALPLKLSDGSTRYPNDGIEREYTVTGWELLAGLDTNTLEVVTIIEGWIFDELIDFKDYIIPFYEERKIAKENGDKAGDIFSKLMMNSLYGKWAADPDNYGKHIIAPHEFGQLLSDGLDITTLKGEDAEIFEDLEGYQPNGEIGDWTILKRDLEDKEKRYYNVATAASITGYVRAYLWRNICKCGGVMYCDTDSIVAVDIADIAISKELGDWGVDGEFTKAAISGKKMYAFKYKKGTEPKDKRGKLIKWKTASKGVKLNARQLIHVARGGTAMFMPESPTYSVHTGPRFTPRRVNPTAKVELK